MLREILLLGDARLYQPSRELKCSESALIEHTMLDLSDTLAEFQRVHGIGRAIAAPQIGAPVRMIFMNIDKPFAFINPKLSFPDNDTFLVRDDCMSFPGLWVDVMRHKRCVLEYCDADWHAHTLHCEGDLSELLQHEYDHLDGILATMRAVDSRAFHMRRNFK